ncbi:hypothetical protein WAF17_02530 [Bernardetia sp. ABR2-2B]|uniref:hypothetical protein n=1 Tax=Bernardetia sp. ABR2-2B TaxID=3127472 RepID=UPI0030D216C0
MALGSRAATQRNNNFLNILIHTGIKKGFLPSTFKKVIGRNTNPFIWQEAYNDGLDNGFEYAKYGQADTDFFKMYWKPQYRQIMNNHTAIWRSRPYRNFEGRAKIIVRVLVQKTPSLIATFSKIMVHILRNKIELSTEAQRIIAQVTGVDLNVTTQSQNQEVIPQCQCVKTGMNGLSGGQVAEPNKVNWGNVAKTVLLGGAAGFGVHKAIDYFTSTPKKSTGLSGLSAGQRKGYNKLKQITARARKIQDKSPRKKWTTCISQAAKELK